MPAPAWRTALLACALALAGANSPQDPVPPPPSPPQGGGTGTEPPPPAENRPETPQEPEEPAEPEPDAAAAPGPLTWSEEQARDKRITFSIRSAVEASAALDRSEASALYRSAAWIVLGSVGSPGDRASIARQARIGKGLERRAAILALGEGPGAETSVLAPIVEDEDLAVAECAMLALLHARAAGARERIEARAASGSDDARSVLAVKLLDYDRHPETAAPPRAVRALVRLRFEAARAFGMIDGSNFAARRISELAADPDFVSAVVLRASVHLPRGAVDDHLLSAFLEGHGPGRLAAVVDAIPSQLSQLVEYGLWTPRDSAEWGVILDEIERQRVEALTPELLRVAEGLPEHGWKARALASRAQRVDLETIARFQIADLAPEDRIEACQALGASDDAAAREMLGGLDQDPDPRVRAAALVARLRLGDRTAAASVEKIVADRTEPDHAAVLESLGRNAREGPIAARLEETMRRAPAADLATVAAALTAQTRSSGRATARSLFALDAPPTGERRYLLVRALSRRPTMQDIEVFTDLFPQPGETELNLELASSLAVLSAPAVRPILRAALWKGEFDESVLAGFLLAQASGLRALIEEILRPPPGVTSADVRRVGFALGEWGGVDALGVLRAATGSAAGPEMQGALLGALGSRTQ
jgi:hypothetical protein